MARITVKLPAVKSGELDPLVTCREKWLLHEGGGMHPKWGFLRKGGFLRGSYRFKVKELYGKTWDEVEEKVNKEIERIKETLLEIVNKKKELKRTKPNDKVITIPLWLLSFLFGALGNLSVKNG